MRQSGTLPRLPTCQQIGSRVAEVGGNRLDPGHKMLPLRLGAPHAAADVLHLLHLPVDASKWLSCVGVDRALVIFPIRDQTDEKRQLRLHHAMIHLMRRRQAVARDGAEFLVHFPIERQLSRERALRIILQRPIRRLKNVAVAIGAEIGGGDRIEEKVSNEVTIAKDLRIARSRLYFQPRCRIR